MKIAIGNNHRGVRAKMGLVKTLEGLGYEVMNFGCDGTAAVDYPEIAQTVAEAVATGQCHRGILIGGNGMGMCMAANKIRGVRAAVAHDPYSAQLTRERHDCNVLCLAAEMGNGQHLEQIVASFLATKFSGGRYARMLEALIRIEREV